MTIDTLPTAPTRSMSAAEFVAAANTFLAALPPFSTQVNADLSALLTLSQLVSTSTTSLTIGTGAQALTVQTSKAYLAGQAVRIYSTATPDNYMDGTVTSYDSGTGDLVVNVTSVSGSGTLAAWTVILNGGLTTTTDLNAAVALRALLAGSASQVFSVATATNDAHAVPKLQAESIATAAGDAAKIQSGTLTATTSGTSIDFTGIPAGVKRITVLFDGVSTNGTSNIMLQIGDAGGIEATGYIGAASRFLDSTAVTVVSFTTGFGVTAVGSAVSVVHGMLTLSLIDASTFAWAVSGVIAGSAANTVSGGTKSLSAELTTVRLTTVGGTDTFDAGSVNIQWEL